MIAGGSALITRAELLGHALSHALRKVR